MINGRLKPCPSSPNCVSSFVDPVDKEHFIEPWRVVAGDPATVWKRLTTIIATMRRVAIVTQNEEYMHAEVTSLIFRFVDDLECMLDREAGIIHWRSASRIGHSDLGANRDRIEAIRVELESG